MRKTSTWLAALLYAVGAGLLSYEMFGHAARSKELAVEFHAERTSLRVGEETRVWLTLRNNGGHAVRLVEPGDGSESGWRTPVVAWSVIKDDPAARHPPEPFTEVRPRECGNVRGLSSGEVFRLEPGGTKELGEWAAWLPTFREPGVYRVAFLYANRPSMDWQEGGGVGFHHPLEMWRVRRSTEAAAVSNELVFTVRD